MIGELVANVCHKHVADKVIHLSELLFHHHYPTFLYYEEIHVCSFNCFEQCITDRSKALLLLWFFSVTSYYFRVYRVSLNMVN